MPVHSGLLSSKENLLTVDLGEEKYHLLQGTNQESGDQSQMHSNLAF